MLLLDPDHLRTLIAIAETGSFARAANEVAKTQSAVSMQMKRLEEVIGVPLFGRDGRTSRLTEDALRLVEYGRRMLRLNDEAVSAFRGPQIAGTVRLGTPDDYADRYLPEILARFSRSHPKVELSVVCAPTSNLVRRIHADELDLAIVTYKQGAPGARVLRFEELYWVAAERHAIHEEPVVPLALGHPTCNWRQTALKALDGAGKQFRVVYSSWNSQVLAAAVMSGLAVSVLPETALRPGMRILRAEDGFPPLPPCEIAVMHASDEASDAVTALENHIIASLAGNGLQTAGGRIVPPQTATTGNPAFDTKAS